MLRDAPLARVSTCSHYPHALTARRSYNAGMTFFDVLRLFSPLDGFAILYLGVAWILMTLRIESVTAKHVSVTILMQRYRHAWMRAYVTRNPRVFDMIALGNLRQGTAFFASSCLIALGGGLALIANTDALTAIAQDLSLDTAPEVVWEMRLLLVLLLMANALFKFIWANRLFGYCAVVMGSAPNDDSPAAYARAEQAAGIANNAARSFNRGLRAVYFSIGAAAWLAGPIALIAATTVTVAVLWRREFNSRSRDMLLRDPPEGASP